ncbi:TonB-dependent receptor [Cupriavidus basilensis OR16]|uniref:TonB-dependent receptor n=1 Tax=Cupriavidus basilensis OR16 TaxID=1127483 RepID=H1SA41_9BURK|nr:TonB-dependent receptor [Cupriavidus basilensis]EHP40590.1 TonB-dependent receptor [Cupriavidus basilensis OR16]
MTLLPVTDSAWAATEAEIATDRRKSNPKDLVALPAVTVTADKTEKPIENVPASVKVMSGEELEQSGISSFEQLEGRIPGLAFQPFGQSGINSPVMRGLTANINTVSTSTLLLVDGVPTLTAQGFENRFIDIDRIEVLRGPQSTLYGRNAEAGVIAVYSRPMDNQPRTSLSAELGSRDKRATRFSLSRPLVEDQLYASVSGEWQRQDGFIDNVNTGGKADNRERYNINLGLRFRPRTTTDFVLRYTRQAYDDGAALWGAPSAPRKQVASGTPSWNHSFGQTFSLNASHEISPDLTIRSITALNDFKDRVQQDTDFRPAEIAYIRRDHHLRTLSQEFRLEGRFRESDWLFGVYGDRSDNDLHSVGKRAMGREDLLIGQKSDTLALFTHWNLSLAPSWTLTVGSRVERYTTRIDPKGASNQRAEWTHFSPKVALQYKLAAGNQVYASVSKGVRNGGFNVLAPAANYIAFEPEKVWSYELGAKGWLVDQTLRYSAAAYYMDVKDMQVMQMPRPGFMYITSAASATSKGVELEADYLLARGWMLRAGLAWNQTRFDRFQDGRANYGGNRNPFAPDLDGHVGIRYDNPRGWYVQTEFVGSGQVYLDAANRYKRNGYGLINLVGGYQRGNWEVAGYVNNLANRTYDAVGYQNGFVTVYSPPREVGVRLTLRL